MHFDRLWILVCLLAACSELPALESGECGNGVIDEEEACDTLGARGEGTRCGTPSEGSLACQYVCIEGAECPEGWSCDPTDICRHATGAYELVETTTPAGLREASLGRVDDDSALDIVGLAATRNGVQAWFGSGEGAFGARFHLGGGDPDSQPGYGDVDGDEHLDAVVPDETGLFVLLGRPDRSLVPLAYSSVEIPAGDVETSLLPVADATPRSHPVLFYQRPGDGQVVVDVMDVETQRPDFEHAPALSGGSVATVAGRLPRADLQPAGTPGASIEDFAAGFLGGSDAYVISLADRPEGDHPIAEILQTVPLPGGLHLAGDTGALTRVDVARAEEGALRFADVDGDGLLDLLASVVGAEGDLGVAVARGVGDGTFGPAEVDAAFDGLVRSRPGCTLPTDAADLARWPIAAGDLDGDRRADFVNHHGIFLSAAGEHRCIEVLDAALAATVDFNRDGNLDIVSAPPDLAQIEIRLGNGRGEFNRIVVETNLPVSRLRVGDFDGDYAGDVAYVEREAGVTEDEPDDRLSVLYGAVDGLPDAPVSMGRLQVIEYIEPSFTPVGEVDYTHDIFAQSIARLSGGRRSIAILVGSPQRRLLAPFSLQRVRSLADGPRGLDTGREYSPRAVQVGDFHLGDEGDDIADLMAVARERGGRGEWGIWWIEGSGEGELSIEGTRLLRPECAGHFDYATALWTKGDVDGEPGDELIGVDQRWGETWLRRAPDGPVKTRVLVLKLAGDADHPRLECDLTELPDGPGGVRQIAFVEGMLLIAAAGPPGVVAYGRDVLTAHGTGAVTLLRKKGAGFRDPVTIAIPDAQILGAAVIGADDDAEPELAILTGEGIWLADIGTEEVTRHPTLAAELATPDGRLLAGDVTGDGLDDLVVSEDTGLRVLRAVANGAEDDR